MNIWDGPIGAAFVTLCAAFLTWELFAPLWRGYTQSFFRHELSRQDMEKEPIASWWNLFFNAAGAMLCWIFALHLWGLLEL